MNKIINYIVKDIQKYYHKCSNIYDNNCRHSSVGKSNILTRYCDNKF
jgi:hypothetical protein